MPNPNPTHRALRLDPEGTVLAPCIIITSTIRHTVIRYTDTGEDRATIPEYIVPIKKGTRT